MIANNSANTLNIVEESDGYNERDVSHPGGQASHLLKEDDCCTARQSNDDNVEQNAATENILMQIEQTSGTSRDLRCGRNRDSPVSPVIRRKRRQDWCRWPVCSQYRMTGYCSATCAESDPTQPGCLRAHIGPTDIVPITPEGEVRVCFDSMGLLDLKCTRTDCHFYHPPKAIRDQIVSRRHAQYLREKVFKSTTDVTVPPNRLQQKSFPFNESVGNNATQWPFLTDKLRNSSVSSTISAYSQTAALQSNMVNPINSLLCAYLNDSVLSAAMCPPVDPGLFSTRANYALPSRQPIDFTGFKPLNIASANNPSPVSLLTSNSGRVDNTTQMTPTQLDAGEEWKKQMEINWMDLLNKLQPIAFNGFGPLLGMVENNVNNPMSFKTPASVQPGSLTSDKQPLWMNPSNLLPGSNYLNPLSQHLISGAPVPLTSVLPSPLGAAFPFPCPLPPLPMNRHLLSGDAMNPITSGQTLPIPFLQVPITLPFQMTGLFDAQMNNSVPNS